ncbi:MAG: acyl-CoA desaturase [Chlamydiia bacterium]|nr:acyl-CoA desaturase [Chlamydiia bacterium]
MINWAPVLFLTIYQAILLVALPLYLIFGHPTLTLFTLTFVLFWVTGTAITFGYHRLFSHRAFKTNPLIETLTLFFASLTFQGSALRWSYEHRLHHAHVDTEKDPYSITKGFWFAHCLWLINKPKPIEPTVVADLMKNPRVMFQHRHAKSCMILSNVFTTLLIAYFTQDLLGAFILTFGLRLFCVHHCTWFINSLAHTWGSQHFCTEHTAVDNFIISLLTFGEGYHNYHHTYARDYRNGTRWYQFDPTKWIIWTLSKCGLATNLRRVSPELISKKIIHERTHLILDQFESRFNAATKELADHLDTLSNHLSDQLTRLNALKQSLSPSREIRVLRRSIRLEMRAWKATLRALHYQLNRNLPLQTTE